MKQTVNILPKSKCCTMRRPMSPLEQRVRFILWQSGVSGVSARSIAHHIYGASL
ncbi:hypothetical protein ROA7745_04188 [Roseovarius aestuarii]|uniref:Uncharacterized protein n=1 Tax=Roseovarius aestuarii TaxID=475083 RepID=A0A1X7BXJ6_9RHOB|nr:hypothetical protein ROA7745_04188 [Roseovarius aestuarii]